MALSPVMVEGGGTAHGGAHGEGGTQFVDIIYILRSGPSERSDRSSRGGRDDDEVSSPMFSDDSDDDPGRCNPTPAIIKDGER